MPSELQIIRAPEFVRLDAHGQPDLEASRAVLAKIASACRKRGINQALLDVRGARTQLTPSDLASLVRSFQDIGFTQHQRLAILHAGDPHHRARMFALISVLRGWSVRAFGDFEAAVLWLSSGKEDESNPKDVPIPIVKSTPRNAAHESRKRQR